MASWPSNLPLPKIDFSGSVSPSVTRTEMEAGVFRQRKRYTEAIETVQVTVPLTSSQWSVFDTFIKTTLNYGNDWFTVSIDYGAGGVSKTARFIGGSYNYSVAEGIVTINAQWEVK